ncbi:MAG: C40 family peptidase [Candidatus Krumholzibacteriota bacterium]|nr:C40 family peptidase [Candidatus Krumholzibacteriota bacterium]
MSAAPQRRLVAASWTALRREPAHAAEQVSQLLLGETFDVDAADAAGEWLQGTGPDGYPGWLRAWHLAPAWAPARAPDRVVVARCGRALAAPRPGAPLLADLSFGTRLAAGPAEGAFVAWHLPDGRQAWTPADELAPWPTPPDARRERVLAWAPALLHIPYEWGGRSCRGLDCSGLVQVLLGAAGLALPRDSALQAAGPGRALATDDPGAFRPGTLLFFGTGGVDHVALLVTADRILHASGCVRLEALADLRHRRELLGMMDPFDFNTTG